MAVTNARKDATANRATPARGKTLMPAVLPRVIAVSSNPRFSTWRISDGRTLEALVIVLLSEGSYVDGTANALVAIECFHGLLCGRIDMRGFRMGSRSI